MTHSHKSEFDPRQYLIKVHGKQDYLPVSARVYWFRKERPDHTIETEIVHMDTERAVVIVRAVIKDPEGRVLATAHKLESARNFPDFLEKAETNAVGRALALMGYGTIGALTEDIDSARLADAPVEQSPQQQPQRGTPPSRTRP